MPENTDVVTVALRVPVHMEQAAIEIAKRESETKAAIFRRLLRAGLAVERRNAELIARG